MGPICVDREAHPESMTCGIQEAIDSLPDYGGTVFIPAGRYVVRRAILPRTNVTLRGEGYATVLTRPAPAISKLGESTRPNETAMRVEDASGFHVGEQVWIADNTQTGWRNRHMVIRRIDGDCIDGNLVDGDLERFYDRA